MDPKEGVVARAGLPKGKAGPLLHTHTEPFQLQSQPYNPKHTAYSFQDTTVPLHMLPQSLKSMAM